MLSPERRARQQADNAAASERKRLAVLALDAAGMCRRCGKAKRDEGLTSCTPCREAVNASRLGRGTQIKLTTYADLEFCVQCAAAGFHREGCEVAP